jgi:LmbE family N-acetylglucosaminyl deacetylase
VASNGDAAGLLGTVLGVWAHPDDETYLSSGVMALHTDAGHRVVCVTATRGEEGSWDEDRWPTATMGAVREKELERALAVVGVTEHHWLDYYDGTCDQVPPSEGRGQVEAFIRDVQPDAVLTFGPDGMTGHHDHQAVSAWTTTAFSMAAKPGARLFYATMTVEWAERFAPVMNRFNVFMEPGTPPQTPVAELAINLVLSPEQLERKLRSIAEHVSQSEGMLEAFGVNWFRESMAEEYFTLAATKD